MQLSDLTLEQYNIVKKKYQSYIYNTVYRNYTVKSFEDWYQWKLDAGITPWKNMRDQRKKDHYSRLRFARHRALAKFRNIEFKFTWEEWHAWWLSHGYDRNVPNAERGADRMCMCRYGDTGPYAPDNVYIATIAENNTDASLVRINKGGRPKGSKNLPKG